MTIATLSACGAIADGASTAKAEGQAQQNDQKERRARQKQEQKAPARSTAKNRDLDAYVASGEKALKEMFGGSFKKMYSDIDLVPVYPNGIEYDYTFRTAVDPAAARPQLNVQAPTLRTQARTVVIPEMKRFGFADSTVTFTYRNPDGSVVWTRTFS